jgi:hypothetical protein
VLNERNVLLIAISIAVVSLLAATLSLASTSQHELGGNTFGVRSYGHRGLFEILEELGFSVERVVGPPVESLSAETTLVFLGPDQGIIEVEPAHLKKVAQWVRQGGQVVYSPSRSEKIFPRPARRSKDAKEPPKSFLELMGISGIKISSVDVTVNEESNSVELNTSPTKSRSRNRSFRNEFESVLSSEATPIASIDVRAEGKWKQLTDAVSTLAVPQHNLRVITNIDSETQSRLVVETSHEIDHVLAASFRIDAGEVVVISDPSIAHNRFVARGDNAVLLAELLTNRTPNVVFDEFYHGLTARGNPLVLLQRPRFSLLLTLLVVTIGVYAWRHGQRLGPAASAGVLPRRTLAEYVDAMARLFATGKNHTPFLLRENRDGLHWMLRKELGLSPSKNTTDDIHAALARHDPKRAESFIACVGEIEELLEREHPSDRDALSAMKKVTDCL